MDTSCGTGALGRQTVKGFWRYAKRLNNEHARKAGAAYEAEVDVIVFEHLDLVEKCAAAKRRICPIGGEIASWKLRPAVHIVPVYASAVSSRGTAYGGRDDRSAI